MITVDSTWMDFDIFKLHSSFLRPKSQKNPQWFLNLHVKIQRGGYGEDKIRFGENLVSRSGDWMDAGDFRFLGRFA